MQERASKGAVRKCLLTTFGDNVRQARLKWREVSCNIKQLYCETTLVAPSKALSQVERCQKPAGDQASCLTWSRCAGRHLRRIKARWLKCFYEVRISIALNHMCTPAQQLVSRQVAPQISVPMFLLHRLMAHNNISIDTEWVLDAASSHSTGDSVACDGRDWQITFSAPANRKRRYDLLPGGG